MGLKDQFQDKAERLQREADQRVGQKRDDVADRSSRRSPEREGDRSRRSSSNEDVYDEDTI
ncbi:hypothetical protein [Streptomyces sp. NPDC005012]|uniref:hypothetical protein n=1 Tax=unclassified Streptomyces TaxID=2593676 RepID=UPI00339DDEE0